MIDYLQVVKNIYVKIIKILKIIFLIKFFDRFLFFRKSYIRSLFSIYDLEELVNFDQIWINIKAKKFLENYLNKNLDILEYGSGSSSFFFFKKSKSNFFN